MTGRARSCELVASQCVHKSVELVVSSLTGFSGACSNFDFNKLRLKIGPAKKAFNLKPGQFGTKWVCLRVAAGKLGGPQRLQGLNILACPLMHILA